MNSSLLQVVVNVKEATMEKAGKRNKFAKIRMDAEGETLNYEYPFHAR